MQGGIELVDPRIQPVLVQLYVLGEIVAVGNGPVFWELRSTI